ncbi:hypothetical protein [Pseudalkalibacillus caeni]|nr:hypothetical protein [Pseudalkalibacillus caeni]
MKKDTGFRAMKDTEEKMDLNGMDNVPGNTKHQGERSKKEKKGSQKL